MNEMLKQLWRLYYIVYRYSLHDLLLAQPNIFVFKWLHWLLPMHWFIRKVCANESLGKRLRLALIEAGTIYVKFGQALSVRHDFLPTEVCQQLALLRDDCPCFDAHIAVQIIEVELAQPIQAIFADFAMQPLASASIAQVHAATLLDGSRVVVKIVRPDIEGRIDASVRSLRAFAKLANCLLHDAQRLRLLQVVDEFAYTLNNEKNMLREASNASLIKHQFKDDETLYVPEIHWSKTTAKVLVMERIDGIAIHQTQQIIDAGIDRKRIAENGVKIFFKQVFEHNLFHADMHPGNVFVDEQGVYKAVDFGIVGALSNEDKLYIAENLLAFFQRNYRRVAELHVQSKWVVAGTRVEELEAAVRSVCEQTFGKTIGELSIGNLLFQLLDVAKQFGMQVQPQLILLQKTLFNIEGLGRELYPDLDLWQTAKPFLQQWIRRELSPRQFVKDLQQNVPYLRYRFPAKFAAWLHDEAGEKTLVTQAMLLPPQASRQRQNDWLALLVLTLFALLIVELNLWVSVDLLTYALPVVAILGVWRVFLLLWHSRET